MSNLRLLLALPIFGSVLAAQQIPQLGAPLSEPALAPNTVVATVAGVSVTIDDVRKMMESAPPAVLKVMQTSPQQFIQQIFLFRYLANAGDELKLGEQSPLKEEIETERKWIIANEMVTHERNNIPVSETELNEFYEKNQARWEQARIKAIFIGFKAGAVPEANPENLEEAAKKALAGAHPANQRSEEEAKKLAGDLVKQLRGGADFGKLVEQYSDDSSSKGSGGEFPEIKANSPYPDDLKKAIFALKAGEISDPIRQPTGFYILRMEEKSLQPLNDVRDPITQEIRQDHLNSWITDLNKRFTPVVQNPQFFAEPQRYLQPGGATPKPAKQ